MEINDEIKVFWEGEADIYSEGVQNEINGTDKAVWKKVLRHYTKNVENLKVLDAGCGPGFFSVVLGEEGHEVIGIDLTENMIDHAKKNTEACGIKSEFRVMDCQNLDFEDESFDLVISRNITWTLSDPQKAYKEWMRVLKPGGRLIVFDACWYLHLFDDDLKRQYDENEKYIIEKYGRPIHQHKDKDFTDKYAKTLFMSDKKRPDWDLKYLKKIGFSYVEADREIYKVITSAEQQEICKMSPEFAIIARK